jgi:hypothetical protein
LRLRQRECPRRCPFAAGQAVVLTASRDSKPSLYDLSKARYNLIKRI